MGLGEQNRVTIDAAAVSLIVWESEGWEGRWGGEVLMSWNKNRL